MKEISTLDFHCNIYLILSIHFGTTKQLQATILAESIAFDAATILRS